MAPVSARSLLVVAAACALVPGRVEARGETYEAALAAYKAYLQRPSLRKRMVGRERLAATDDPRALAILAASYSRAEEPRDQVQYLLASLTTDRFAEAEHLPVYEAWRKRCDSPKDAWLWFKSLGVHGLAKGAADLDAVVRSDRGVFLRAAAIEALRSNLDRSLLASLPELARLAPAEGVPRAVFLESVAACLPLFRDQRRKPEFRAPAEAVIALMDDDKALPRTRIVVARCLARALQVKFTFRSGDKWRSELDFVQSGGKQASMEGYAPPPTFAGIEATGDRICYVIDMSDSMLTPLTPAEKEKLPKGPVTGVARPKESDNDAWERVFEAVDWKKVKTRFDAARELLKASLLGLREGQSFAVLWFGDQAGALQSTPGMTKTTLAAVKSVFRELDAIKAGPAKQGRPLGTIRGNTNLHGGLHRAFKLHGRGFVGPGEFVDPSTWNDGCDTIFVLTDGEPTWDDWAAADKRDPEDNVGDPETGARLGDSDTLEFAGPYREAGALVDDVLRLNLFRKAEIHCVGLGEASMNTLERLAGVGCGRAISLSTK